MGVATPYGTVPGTGQVISATIVITVLITIGICPVKYVPSHLLVLVCLLILVCQPSPRSHFWLQIQL